MIPSLLFQAYYDADRCYLNGLQKTYVPMFTQLFSQIIHIAWLILMIDVLELDLLGISLANGITQGINLVIMTIYCKSSKDRRIRRSYFFFTKQSFENIGEYVGLMIPSALLNMIEWSAFEIIIIFSGFIDVDT